MVLNASNHQGLHAVLARDAAKIRPDTVFNFRTNPGLAILGAENDVAMEGGERVGHAREGNERHTLPQPKISSAAPRRAAIECIDPWDESHAYRQDIATRLVSCCEIPAGHGRISLCDAVFSRR
jgi:hypothetical protein